MNEESMNGCRSVEKVLQGIADSVVKVGQRWRHFKGEVYVVQGFSISEATTLPLVLYTQEGCPNVAQGSIVTWARPLYDFLGCNRLGTRRFVLLGGTP